LFSSTSTFKKGDIIMGGTKDIVKGRVEEAAGALTGNEQPRNKGRAEQQIGKVENAIQNVADSAKAAAAKVVAGAKNAAPYKGK